MQWDVFCRVVDNWGDVGFGWRLAADLGARGEAVRFWLDEQAVLAWMAPQGAPGVEVRHWSDAGSVERGNVVVEILGCGLPDAFAALMQGRPSPPAWINVEYLGAENYVERSHGLPSPRQNGPAAGLTQWFFYPGFTAATGGLLREPDLTLRQQRFGREDWMRRLIPTQPAAQPAATAEIRTVSLFCYDAQALPALLDEFAAQPTRLLVTAGRAAEAVAQVLGPGREHGALQVIELPRISQLDYDHLLWSCDLNFVRGEDSFVRAQWAGLPFVWQPYPQADGVHLRKLDAFLNRFLADAPADLEPAVRRLHAVWNGSLGGDARPELPELSKWRDHCSRWRAELLVQTDLTSRLTGFACTRLLK